MICPNPNCKSIIPDDSKFCPDCGTAIKNIASLRTEAKDIVEKYPKGYKALVDSGILPPYSEYLSAEGYELILKKESDIVQKQEECLRQDAYLITISYQNGYEYYVSNGAIPRYSDLLSSMGYEKIIAKKADVIKKHQEIEAYHRQTEETIRKEALDISNSYSKGYRYYVNKGAIPPYGHYMNIEDCKKIISLKNEIIKKHQELEIHIEELRKKAKEITSQHPKAYNLLTNVGSLPYITYNMTAEDCKKIISAKSELEKKQRELENEEKREIDSSIHLEASNIYYLYTNAYNLKSATTLKNDIELKEKRFDAEKDAQSGGNRHKVA